MKKNDAKRMDNTPETQETAISPPSIVYLYWLVFLFFGVSILLTSLFHEPWLDEAQAWLLVKNSSLWDLLAHRLRYEGHPPLWYLILWIPVKFGFPYSLYSLIPVALACVSCWLILFRSPFPAPVRIMMPFGFFLFYQYGVIARSYSLLPILVFWLAATYHCRFTKPLKYWIPITLLILSSVHGAVFALASAALTVLELPEQWNKLTFEIRRSSLTGLSLSITGLAVVVALIWPPHDLVASLGIVDKNMVSFIDQSFASNQWISLLALGTGMLWMDHNRTLLAYVIVMSGLLILSSHVFKIYHEGIFYLAWIFGMWLAWDACDIRPHNDLKTRESWKNWLKNSATVAVLFICLVHVWWASQSVFQDIRKPYSGAEELAEFIRNNVETDHRIFTTGIHTVAAIPYLENNPFFNVSPRKGHDFVLWSTQNRILSIGRKLDVQAMKKWILTVDPDWIVVPVNAKQARPFLNMTLQLNQYKPVYLCKGEHFWKGEVFRLDGFMVFQNRRNRLESVN